MTQRPGNDLYRLQTPDSAQATVARWETAPSDVLTTLGRWPYSTQAGTSWVVQCMEEDSSIGSLLLAPQIERKTLAFSIWIAPPFRQRGHGFAVGSLVIRWGFQNGFLRIETAHAMDAPGAAQLAERLGFLPEGVQRAALTREEGRIDLAHWGLLQSDR